MTAINGLWKTSSSKIQTILGSWTDAETGIDLPKSAKIEREKMEKEKKGKREK